MKAIKSFLPRNTKAVFSQIPMVCMLTISLIGQIGCIVPTVEQSYQTTPILYGILTENRSASDIPEFQLATPQEWRQIRVLRSDSHLNTMPRMPLNIGDEVWTGPNSAVVIHFPNSSQMYLRSNSHIKIGSAFTFFGELFVRVRGAFQVDTEFVTAGAEGTEWVMLVSPNGDTRSTVLEGSVRIASRENFWRPMLMTANNQNQIVTRNSRYTEIMLAPQEEISKMKHWIGEIDRLAQESQPQVIKDDVPFPFIIQFNFFRRYNQGMRGDGSERTNMDNRSYP